MPPSMEDLMKRNAYFIEKYGHMPTGAEYMKACQDWMSENISKELDSEEKCRELADGIVRARR